MKNHSPYNRLSREIVEKLRRIVGDKNVIFNDPDRLEPFSHDQTPGRQWAHMPEAVVRPRTARQIARVMTLANRSRVPVTPRGAGSGLSGGAVPLHGGIVLLVDRMNRIIEIDPANMMAVVEPGVVTNDINSALKEHGLFYAGYPMSMETCFIGGNVAENAGGARAVKYGVTGRYVTALEVVTPTGRIVELGGKLLKDVTGYDLVHLLVGSEGTLGIFTKITLKLMPLPRASADLLCLFPSVRQAISAVPAIMTGGGVIPTAIEFMDSLAVRAACEYLNESFPYQQAEAMLLITVEGSSAGQVEVEYDAIGEQCLSAGASEVYVADNPTNSERIWRVRRNIAEAFGLYTSHQSGEDLVVPISAIPRLVGGMARIGRKYDVLIPTYGHAGDGNMHTRVLMNADWSVEKWNKILPRILDELYELTARLGGKISGEHGIGHKRKAYLPRFVDSWALELMRSIKRAWDPNNILNPGKIFDA